jgi:hypothetical protein
VINRKLRDIYGMLVNFVDVISIADRAGNFVLTGLIIDR